MSNVETNKVPPDGGYGWVVTIAYAMNNVIVLPIIACFGLVLNETDLTTSEKSFILILNQSIGKLLSFFGGPLLIRFGYRKTALLGTVFISAGVMSISQTTAYWQFILSYSIICSMGVAAIMQAFTLAINLFFKEKRGRAVGVSMSITGLGFMTMPFLINFLIHTYEWKDAVLILGAICLHSLVAACLLRPAKWYLRDPPTSEEAVPLNKEPEVELINDSVTPSSKVVGIASLPPHLEESGENGVLPSKSLSMRSLTSNSSIQTRNAISHSDIRNKELPDAPLFDSRYNWSQEINLSSSINIFNEIENQRNIKAQEMEIFKEKEKKKGYVDQFIQFFDLTLLTDPIFVNIIFGTCIAACVEINFLVLFPVILKDMMPFESAKISKLMAVMNFSDMLFRFVSPFIGQWCNKSPRAMYMFSLFMTIFTRSMMMFTTSFISMIFVSLGLGITKAIRTVCESIVIPNYVPIHRLAFASGIQMFFSGVIILTIGSLLTKVREASGSYIMPIIVLNFVTLITLISWSAEFLYFRLKDKPKPEPEAET